MKNSIILSAFIVAAAATTMAWSQPLATTARNEIDYTTRKHYCGTDLINIIDAVCKHHDVEETEETVVDVIPDEFPEEDVDYNDGTKASLTLECCLLACYPDHIKSYCKPLRDDGKEKGTGIEQRARYVKRPMFENNNFKRMVKVMQKVTDSRSGSEQSSTAAAKNKLHNIPNNAKAEAAAGKLAAINQKYVSVDEGKIVVATAVDRKIGPKYNY